MKYKDHKAKQDKISKAYSLAYNNEQNYGCCPQCVLAAIQDVLGIVDNETFKASHGLAGGGRSFYKWDMRCLERGDISLEC
jgi:hypothetical protein